MPFRALVHMKMSDIITVLMEIIFILTLIYIFIMFIVSGIRNTGMRC